MTAPAGARRGRAGLWIVLVLGLLVAVGALSVGDEPTARPYDPASYRPDGTRAFVELLRSFGTDVDVPASFSLDAGDPGTILVFQDLFTDESSNRLRAWVEAGGTLVVTDPFSPLVPIADLDASSDPLLTPATIGPIPAGECTVAALGGVEAIRPWAEALGPPVPPPTYEVGEEDASCFGDGVTAFAVVTPLGAGQVVALADGAVFMNGALGEVDNAALATSLLAPAPGGRVTLLEPGAFGDPSTADGPVGSIGSIVGAPLPFVLLEAALAVVVLGLAQGRRLGRPVAEPQPVQIASSELVAATGDLLQQAGAPDRAAAVLRADLRRELSARIGVPLDAPVEVLADALGSRTSLGRDQLLAVLADGPVTRADDLVALARSIDSIREEILHVPTA